MVEPAACTSCRRPLAGGARFVLGTDVRCLFCAIRYRPVLRRSVATGLMVGTVLVAINQGGAIAAGHLGASLIWQIPLTYAVPFCVATWGALSNSRVVTRQPIGARSKGGS